MEFRLFVLFLIVFLAMRTRICTFEVILNFEFIMSKNIHSLFIGSLRPLWIAVGLLVIILLLGGYSYLPLSREQMKKTIATLECKYYYILTADNKEILFFGGINNDTTMTDVSLLKDSATQKSFHPACWVHKLQFIPSCEGRLMALFAERPEERIRQMNANDKRALLSKEVRTLSKKITSLKKIRSNMNYYLRVHNATDEGFNIISEYAQHVNDEIRSEQEVLDAIDKAEKDERINIKYKAQYTVIYQDDSMIQKRVACHIVDKREDDFIFVKINTGKTPEGAHPLFFHLWITWHIPQLAPGKMAPNDVPEALAIDGSPIFSKFGFFIGIKHQNEVMSSDKFKFSLLKIQ